MWQLLFTQSSFLWGITGALIPLIIHILHKQRIKTVNFPSLYFIKLSFEKRMNTFRLKEIILLIVRMLLIALIAACMARPVQKFAQDTTSSMPAHALSSSRNVRTAAVIILDNSVSMGYYYKGLTLFKIAQKIARTILDEILHPGDTFSIICPSDTIPVKLDNLSYNIEAGRMILKNTQPGYLPADIPQALADARRLLRDSVYPNKVVFLLTDLSRAGWIDAARDEYGDMVTVLSNTSIPFRNTELHLDGQIFIIDLAASVRGSRNAAVEELRLPQKLFGAGESVSMGATIHNYGIAAADITGKVIVGDRTFGQAATKIPPRSSVSLDFINVFDTSGLLNGEIRLENDNLKLDNRYYFTLYVPSSVHVFIADDAGKSDFLVSAFNPAFFINQNNSYLIRPSVHPSSQLTTLRLSSYSVAVLADFSALHSQAAISRLSEYVRNGGSALIFLNDSLDINVCNGALFESGLLPGRILHKVTIDAVHTASEEKGYTRIDILNTEHPSLSIFADNESLTAAHIYQYYQIAYDAGDPNIQILARLEDDRPLIFEHHPINTDGTRRGTVITIALGPDESMSDIVFNASFPPLLHESVKYLLNRTMLGKAQYPIGTRIDVVQADLEVDSTTMVEPVSTAAPISVVGNRLTVPGIYRLGSKYFSCNTLPEQSDIQRISFAQLKKTYTGLDLYYVTAAQDVASQIKRFQFGRELWPLLLIMALAVLMAEIFLANRWDKMQILLKRDLKRILGGILGNSASRD